MRNMRHLTVLLAAAVALVAGLAIAADYPTKPVQLMVAYPAGGSTDVAAARIVAAIAEKELGQSAVKVMVGEEYARYYRDLHAKAAKYTEWARNRPHR